MVVNFQNTATESPQNILPLWSTTDWSPSVRRSLPSPQWGWQLGWRRHSFCHVRLGVNFMSWSNFCVLVWLSVPWRDFITLSDIIRTCGHVMDDVITMVVTWILVWFFSALDEIFVLVGFCLSWCDFIPWCNQPNLGMIFLRLGRIFFFLVGFCLSWCDFIPWCSQPNLGMIFLCFGYNVRLSEIIFLLVSFHILVRSTASWYDFPSFH